MLGKGLTSREVRVQKACTECELILRYNVAHGPDGSRFTGIASTRWRSDLGLKSATTAFRGALPFPRIGKIWDILL